MCLPPSTARTFSVNRLRPLVSVIAASTTVALLLASSFAAAQAGDADGDGVPDYIEDATQRNVVALTSGDSFEISSRLESEQFADQFNVFYKAGTFRVSYERAGGSGSSYQLELRSLVEWVDRNGNNRIDENEIANGSSPLGSVAFAGMPVTMNRTENEDGGVINTFAVSSRGGEVSLDVTVAERFMRISPDRVLTPMEVKLNLTVDHVIVSTGASLGLDVRITTGYGRSFRLSDRSWDEDNGFARDETGINVTNVTQADTTTPSTVFFSWSKSASANGLHIPVTASNFSGGSPGTYDVYLAYPMSPAQSAVTLVHDPVLGVDSAAYQGIVNRHPELQGDIVLYVGSLLAMVALVAVTIVVANRRRKKREE
jgi:hypothetical protein